MLGADLALMRLLEVEVFGLAAFGLMVVGACALLRSMGVGEALIQAERVDPASRDTALYMALSLGAGAWLLLWAAAPWVAGLLADGGELAVSVLRAMGAVLLLDAEIGRAHV